MSVPATPAAAPTASAPSAPSAAPATSKPATPSTSSGSPSGKPTPMTANQFRAQLRGQQTSPFESAPVVGASVDELESPLGLDRSEADLDQSLEAQSEELQQETNSENDDSEQVSDFSWAEALQDYKDGIHNTPLVELLQALAQGQIPEALWDKLHIPLKDGDFEWQDTLANARNGAMMRAKFTQKMQEFAKEKQAFAQEKGELVEYLGGWKNDATGIALLKGLKRMGMPFDAMARAYAAEVAKIEAMDPTTREVYEHNQRLEAENEEIKRRQAREQTQQTEQKSTQDTTRIATAVKNAAAKTFEQNGLPMTQGSWNVFREHLSALWTASGLEAPTMEMVTEATLATKEFVVQAQQNHTKAIAAQAPVKAPLTARAVDSGATRSVPKTSPVKKSITAAEFRKKLAHNPFQR